jgi:hypothetical protein
LDTSTRWFWLQPERKYQISQEFEIPIPCAAVTWGC